MVRTLRFFVIVIIGVSGEPFRMHRKPKNEQDKPTYPCSKDCYLYLTEVKVENESSDEEEPVFHKKANLKIKPRPFTKRAEQKFRKLQQINRYSLFEKESKQLLKIHRLSDYRDDGLHRETNLSRGLLPSEKTYSS